MEISEIKKDIKKINKNLIIIVLAIGFVLASALAIWNAHIAKFRGGYEGFGRYGMMERHGRFDGYGKWGGGMMGGNRVPGWAPYQNGNYAPVNSTPVQSAPSTQNTTPKTQ